MAKVGIHLLLLSGVMLACSNDGTLINNKYVATYEIQAGCTTGIRTLSAVNPSVLEIHLCEELIDQVSNSNCGLIQREQIYKTLNCNQGWPYNTNNSGLGTHIKSYSFDLDGCRTGTHYFASNAKYSANRLYCRALMDEGRNHRCAYSERVAAYYANDCDSY